MGSGRVLYWVHFYFYYIYDLPYLKIDDHEIVLFADVTSNIFKVKHGLGDLDEVNRSLGRIVHWISANNLLLNEDRTKLSDLPDLMLS